MGCANLSSLLLTGTTDPSSSGLSPQSSPAGHLMQLSRDFALLGCTEKDFLHPNPFLYSQFCISLVYLGCDSDSRVCQLVLLRVVPLLGMQIKQIKGTIISWLIKQAGAGVSLAS